MANIKDFASLTIGLSVNPPSQATFTTSMLMVDTSDVPVDKRYAVITKDSFATDLTDASDAYDWANTLWGQNYNPDQAYIGRWVSAAIKAYLVCNGASSTIGDYTTVAAAGKFNLDDGTNQEDISPDFTGDVDMDDVAASINAALAASTNFSGYTCTIDVLDRLIITGAVAGSASPSFSIGAPASGTDLSGASYLNAAASFLQSGLDAETLGASANAVLALDNTPFILCERGGSVSEQVAFATTMNAKDKITLLVTNDTNAKSGAITTDLGYQIEALGYNKCFLPYTEHTTQDPDAAICGEIFPRKEATTNLAFTPLTGVSESGLGADGTTVKPITAGEGTILKGKGYDWLVKPATVTHFTHGLAPGGNEIRIMVGKLFCEAKVSEDVYAYLIANDVVTFSDDDINAIKGIVEYWLSEMVSRKVLDAGYVIDMPLASSFTAATKATHIMDLDNVTSAETQRAVNEVNISLSWSV